MTTTWRTATYSGHSGCVSVAVIEETRRRLAVEQKLRLRHVVVAECWRWTGAHTPKGYGQLSVDGKAAAVHRLAHELWIGPIPDGFEIDHLCRIRDCVNPAHLEAVTHAENNRRAAAARTGCVNGHPYTPETMRVRTSKGKTSRVCLICRRAINQAYKARRRAHA